MSMRWIVIALVLGTGVLAWVAWNGNTRKAAQAQAPAAQEAPAQGAPAMPPSGDGGGASTPPGEAAASDPGVTWDKPASWTDQAPRMMRLATYTIPGRNGDAECAVYYFGPGQGGTVEANMARWIGEFETPSKPDRSSGSVDGIPVARVRVKGTYRAHAGGMGGQSDAPAAAHQELLGAIVEAPGGSVFFKLTGPAATVDAAYGDFEHMMQSLKKK